MKCGIFSDLHLHNFQQFSKPMGAGLSSRAYRCLSILIQIRDMIKTHSLDRICFCGDFWDVRGLLPVPVFNVAFQLVSEISKRVDFIMIRGQHDLATGEKRSASSIDAFSELSGVYILDNLHSYKHGDIEIFGVGADDVLAPLPKRKAYRVVLLHTSLKGVQVSVGNDYRMDEGLDPHKLDVYMKKYEVDFVAIGDIHLRQDHKKNVVFVGCCIQKSFGDAGQSKGMIVLDTEGSSYEFVKLDSPKFYIIDAADLDEAMQDPDFAWSNDFDYFRVNTKDKQQYNLWSKHESAWNTQILPPEKVTSKKRSEINLSTDHKEAMRLWVNQHEKDKKEQKRLLKYGLEFIK